MKTTILILSTKPWEFQGKSGTSASFLFDKLDKLHSTSIKDDVLKSVTNAKLPALFEVDIDPVQKNFDGKSQLKFNIETVKFVREVAISFKI